MCENCKMSQENGAKFCPECGISFGEVVLTEQTNVIPKETSGLLINSVSRSNAEIRKQRNQEVVQGFHRAGKRYLEAIYDEIAAKKQAYEKLFDISPDNVTSLGLKNFNADLLWDKALEIEEKLVDLEESYIIAQRVYKKATGIEFKPQEIKLKFE